MQNHGKAVAERTVLLVDMNSFFASVEQQSNPSLIGLPVAVGGPAGSRSVVSAASYEAREFGVHSAMPVSEALRLCPKLVLVSGDMKKYVDTSRRIFRICSQFTDLLEVYSIDECFMDVTPTMHLFGGAVSVAEQLKEKIRTELGLTCSVGIGPNKILAKLAAGMKKPDGLTVIRPGDVSAMLENLPVDRLHGIGEKVAGQLRDMAIPTAGILGRTPAFRLRKHFGVLGDVLQSMGKGCCEDPVVPYYRRPETKSIGHSHTLDRDTLNWQILSRNLLRLCEMVGRRLREANYSGRTITLSVRHQDMQTITRRRTLADYLCDGFEIYMVAQEILRKEVQSGKSVRLLGVSVSNLVRGSQQQNMFADPRQAKLREAVDSINDKFGEFKVLRASLLDSGCPKE